MPELFPDVLTLDLVDRLAVLLLAPDRDGVLVRLELQEPPLA